MKQSDCIFCKLASKEIPTEIFWENEDFVAFLDIKPTSRGMSLVVPKKHIGSDVMKVPNDDLLKTMEAVREVAKILDEKLEGNMRTTLLFEGIEVDHLHAKLIPFYEEDMETRKTLDVSLEDLVKLSKELAS